MTERMNRVLMTGGTGAVGTALIAELLESGAQVTVLCRKDSPRLSALPVHERLKVRFCSLSELARLDNGGNETYDAFYHLGWEGTTGSGRNDMTLQCSNIRYALDAVSAAKRFGCRVFVGAGSQAEYGRTEGRLSPRLAAFPENGYGAAKLSAGHMTRLACRNEGIRHVWCRILSVYGPNDGNSMIMTALKAYLRGEEPAFTKGEQMWDYLCSFDAARALRRLGESGIDGKVYVLGSGKARQLSEYIRVIRDTAAPGHALRLGEVPYAPGQVMHLEADISELTEDTGWKPEISFEEGIRRTMEWLRAQTPGDGM